MRSDPSVLRTGSRRAARARFYWLFAGWVCAFAFPGLMGARGAVVSDPAARTVTLSDRDGNLRLRLRYDGRCVLDQVWVRGRNVVAPDRAVASGIRVGDRSWSTRLLAADPKVEVAGDEVTVSAIRGGDGPTAFVETWHLAAGGNRILWRIEREYPGEGGLVDDVAQPEWAFRDLTTWTGGLLEHGGVAWVKLFDQPRATYGVHGGSVLFWNRSEGACLKITGKPPTNGHLANRFSREVEGGFTLAQTPSPTRLSTRHGQSRFLKDRQDVWAPWRVRPGVVTVEWALEALGYDQAFDRGEFVGFNGGAIREILNTIARIGAIDDEVMGSNGYYSGFAVLHEPWIAQLGLAIDDPGYLHAFARTLDHQRDHAIGPDGRVKSRWAYTRGDEQPGSYDPSGYYECQWGWLMDSQPSYVINVAEQFDLTGDRVWLAGHKASAEKALAYLLDRDADGDGLVEMATDSHRTGKGSDWIDVIWASHENGFVNAQLYRALTLWADAEELLRDVPRAAEYRRRASNLRSRFNAPTPAGGLWDASGHRFVHWRDRDDSIHGTNLVVPVNFMAVAYGLCDPPERARDILDQIETRTRQEGLFFWPICLDSYQPGEGIAWQFPFPKYENGDLFLAWGEVGTRAYARYDPAIALKYVRNVLERYERDGLAFQRYLRTNPQGEGNDILANNSSVVVGLYRNIYGIQPKWNRLFLDPHLVPDLNGTRLKYVLRGQTYEIDLAVGSYRVSVDGFTLRSGGPFGISTEPGSGVYCHGTQSDAALLWRWVPGARVELGIVDWPDDDVGTRRWTILATEGRNTEPLLQTLSGLKPGARYRLTRNGAAAEVIKTDNRGEVRFRESTVPKERIVYELALEPVER